jgi:Sec63 Brl domain
MKLGCGMRVQAVMGALCGASEYDELPVRHNEDNLNLGLSKEVGRRKSSGSCDCAHPCHYSLRHGCPLRQLS